MNICQAAAVLACRVLALYLAVWWLGLIPLYAFQSFIEPVWSSIANVFLFVVPVALAVVLWKLAPWIAKRMLADVEDGQASISPVTMEDAQAVALSVLGLLFIGWGIPGVVVVILDYLRIPGIVADANVQFMMRSDEIKALVMRIVEIGLGIWLFLGARTFVRVFQRFDRPKTETDSEPPAR